ncbi:A24 family peptidase [Desulfocicer niacini]
MAHVVIKPELSNKDFSAMPPYTIVSHIIIGITGIFGALVGSFLNVCIYRIPRGKSILFPGSSCPVCNHPIPFYLNVPIVSYMILKGRCRHCQAPFSIRYPGVEALTAAAAMITAWHFGMTVQGAVWFLFICTLAVISFIDYDFQIIPDSLSLPGIPVFTLATVLGGIHPWQEALIGILTGGGSLYVVALVYHFIRKEEGMGGGDIKLLAMIGAATGWQGVLFTIFAGSLAGTLAGGLAMAINRRTDFRLRIPFGPYLSAGAIIYIFKGQELIEWYSGWVY